MIAIVDYGVGNLGSIKNMLKKIGASAEIVSDPEKIFSASKLILPGVGAFDAGMACLEASGLHSVLDDCVRKKGVPVLGICLGMQLMTLRSEEGTRSGLGWIDAEAVKFDLVNPKLKVPHMGWNLVSAQREDPLLESLTSDARFYFVHSYHVVCRDPDTVLLKTNYEVEFHSAFRQENVWGVQFHPEKSHKFGMQLLRNFAERC